MAVFDKTEPLFQCRLTSKSIHHCTLESAIALTSNKLASGCGACFQHTSVIFEILISPDFSSFCSRHNASYAVTLALSQKNPHLSIPGAIFIGGTNQAKVLRQPSKRVSEEKSEI